jgi:hypothetical protein
MKIYRRHRCSAQHRTFRTFANCVWPRAAWVHGEGPFALVAYCGRRVTVSLHATADAAEENKWLIDDTACVGSCCRSHEIIRLADPAARVTGSKGAPKRR